MCIYFFLKSLQNIAPVTSGLRVQCQAPAHSSSSFLALTSVRTFCKKAGGNVNEPKSCSSGLPCGSSAVADWTCSFFIHRSLVNE